MSPMSSAVSHIGSVCLGFAIVFLPPLSLSASAAGVHYQQQRTLNCSGGFCTGSFPKAGKDRVLILESVICEGSVENGTIEQAYVSFNVKGKQFILPLALDWDRTQGNFRSYTFSRSAKIEVPSGESPSAVLAYDGAVPSGRCILSGTARPE
jgi:hypothetical protein